MLRPSGSAWIAMTSAPASAYATGVLGAVQQIVHPADRAAGRAADQPVAVRDGGLDALLHLIRELLPARGEELDAVVRHRVVRGGEHHAQVGLRLADQVRHRRGGQHPDPQDVGAGAGQARDHGRLQHLAAGARIAPDDGQRRVAAVGLGQHPGGRDGDREGQLGGEVVVRESAYAVGAEESPHGGMSFRRCLPRSEHNGAGQVPLR
jgi:hypothetical protein